MQSIADLSMGERFKELARQITLDVHEVLAGEAFIMPHIPSKSWYKALPDTYSRNLQFFSETVQEEGIVCHSVCHK